MTNIEMNQRAEELANQARAAAARSLAAQATKAARIYQNHEIDGDTILIAVGWVSGRMNMATACRALKVRQAEGYSILCRALRRAFIDGRLALVD